MDCFKHGDRRDAGGAPGRPDIDEGHASVAAGEFEGTIIEGGHSAGLSHTDHRWWFVATRSNEPTARDDAAKKDRKETDDDGGECLFRVGVSHVGSARDGDGDQAKDAADSKERKR